MFKKFIVGLEVSNGSPAEQIQIRDFVAGVLKAGSLISILENKKINSTSLFTLLLENPQYQDFFVEVTSSKDFKESILKSFNDFY